VEVWSGAMSFEGYTQHICCNGHYWVSDAYYPIDECVYCRAPSDWENLVDQTNCCSVGNDILKFTDQEVVENCDLYNTQREVIKNCQGHGAGFTEPKMRTEAEYKVCDKCGSNQLITPRTYYIPGKEQS
jgi:hypothetical protein